MTPAGAVTEFDLCPSCVDRRACSAAQLSTMVLDAQPDLLGPKFVLRPAVGRAS